jgi:hypothetical protein
MVQDEPLIEPPAVIVIVADGFTAATAKVRLVGEKLRPPQEDEGVTVTA